MTSNAMPIISDSEAKFPCRKGFEEIIPLCQTTDPNLQATDMPFPRSGHRLLANDRYAVCIGGYNPSLWNEHNTQDTYYPILKEVWLFNLLTHRWKKMQTNGVMPKELASHAALLHDNFALVYGGTGVPFGHSSTNDLHALNLTTGTWSLVPLTTTDPLANTTLPKQYGHAFVRDKHNLYVIGGTSGFHYNMQVFGCEINLDSSSGAQGQWRLMLRGNEAAPRYRHEAFYFDGRLHVLGGGTATNVCALTNLDVFDIATGLWSTKPVQPDPDKGFPSPRRCHGLAVYEDPTAAGQQLTVFVCGGYDGTVSFDDVWELKVALDGTESRFMWRRFAHDLPRPLYFHGMACTPSGSLLVFGGVDGVTQERSSKLYRCWLKPPSLFELSMREIFTHLGKLDERQISKMLSTLHIPGRAMDWLTNRW